MNSIMSKTITLLAGVILLTSCAGRQAMEHDLAERLSAAMAVEVSQGFSGAVLVASGGRIIHDRAYGSMHGVTMTTRSRFWLSSTAKQFVSAAVLKAEALGMLAIEDTVGSIFPDAPGEFSTITIEQLLSHTSGLGQHHGSEQAHDRAQALAAIFSIEPEPSAIGQFRYSNANYQLAAAMIEEVSRLTYVTFLQQHFWGPLGLSDTGQTSEAEFGRVAPVAFGLPERLKKDQWGSQGIYSTTHDLLTWYQALASGAVLSNQHTTQLFSATVPIGEGAAALGWFEGANAQAGQFRFTRGNDDYGANSLIYAYPAHDTVIIILTHAGQKDDDISYSRAALAALERALWPAK